MSVEALYTRLEAAASLEGEDGAVVIDGELSPVGGPGTKVNPPTYPTDGRDDPYVHEKRYQDGTLVDTVLVDAVQAQANRCEEALQGAIDRGLLSLPHLRWGYDTDERHVRMTSLTAPHRSRDAYFRDSELAGDGGHFEKSTVGRSLYRAAVDAARPYLLHTPADLVYGVWDSQRGGVGIKVPRAYSSEIVGWDAEVGEVGAGRFDPLINIKGQRVRRSADDRSEWELAEKGDELSKVNLGMIPPTRGPRGVSVTRISRTAVVSFPITARLSFPEGPGERADPEVDRCGRALVAALGLLGDRLAFDRPAIFLRSGCTLQTEREVVAWAGRGGRRDAFECSRDTALELFEVAVGRCAEKGLVLAEPIELSPRPNLREAIAKSLATPDED